MFFGSETVNFVLLYQKYHKSTMEINEFIYNVRHLRKDLLLQARRYFDNTEDAEDAVQETLAKLWVAKNAKLPPKCIIVVTTK